MVAMVCDLTESVGVLDTASFNTSCHGRDLTESARLDTVSCNNDCHGRDLTECSLGYSKL